MGQDPAFPDVGNRVAIRSRRPEGSVPPFTDTVGELLSVGDSVDVLNKSGAVVHISQSDIVSVRALPPVPILNRDIRSMQRAAAFGWPGTEHAWIDGWFARAGGGHTLRANSAVPLEHSASPRAIPELAEWYEQRGLPLVLCLPDRLIHPPEELPTSDETVVLVRDIDEDFGDTDPVTTAPSTDWLALHGDSNVEVLNAVLDGTVGFTEVRAGEVAVAVARGAVTEGWVGISSVRVAESHRRRGLASRVCRTLLDWGRSHGARRAFVQVHAENTAGLELYPTLGFTEQHRYRYARIDVIGRK